MVHGREARWRILVLWRYCSMAAAIRGLLALALMAGAAPAATSYQTILEFPAADTQREFSVDLSRDVILTIKRTVDAHGVHMGWGFAAIDRRLADSPNFFYDCLCGHGPRPHDLYAWHFVENYYPSERSLPVYGYPIEVRVRCIYCEVAGGNSRQAHFTGGTVEVSWRRLPKNNPRQLRIADVVCGAR